MQGDPAALAALLHRHRERLRRIVSIRLAARLARVLDEEMLPEDLVRASLSSTPQDELATEAGLVRWMARLVEREVRRRADGTQGEGRGLRRSLRVGGEADPSDTVRARREDLERLVDARVTELDPELREVLLLRDYCGAEWEFVRERLGLISVEAAQELYRRAHERLARRVRPQPRKQS